MSLHKDNNTTPSVSGLQVDDQSHHDHLATAPLHFRRFPLRQSFADLMRQGPSAQEAIFAPLTTATMALTYVLAVSVPSIWVVISLVGSLSASVASFIMPALVIIKCR